jgi:hypothetical protein
VPAAIVAIAIAEGLVVGWRGFAVCALHGCGIDVVRKVDSIIVIEIGLIEVAAA